MPLSPIIPYPRVRTTDVMPLNADELRGNHVHVYLNKSGPDDPPRRPPAYTTLDRMIRDSSLPAVDRAVLQRIRDAAMIGAGTDPIKHQKTLAKDQNEPENDPRLVAVLDPVPDGFHYEIESREQGQCVVLVEGPPPSYMGEDGPIDPKLRRMNRDAARFWRTRDADIERTVYVLDNPGPGGRYELRENPNGTVNVIWISPDRDDMINGVQPPGADGDKFGKGTRPGTPQLLGGNTPRGASGDGPEINSGSSPPSRTADKLRRINATNRAFWARRR